MKWTLVLFFLLFNSFSVAQYRSIIRSRKPIINNIFFDFSAAHQLAVKKWLYLFQNQYSDRFRTWLGRSYRYSPLMKNILRQYGLPEDLVYLAMIESGFSAVAISSAQAVGYWQFIASTADRFGLKKTEWLDERRDFEKSTIAAARYLDFLHKKFNSWYLAIAAYNMGETRLEDLIKKYETRDFWRLSKKKGFPLETAEYIPKFIAARMIAKDPVAFGFNYFSIKLPYSYDVFYLPGGTVLQNLATYIGQPYSKFKKLNPAILKGKIPVSTEQWRVRIPKGAAPQISAYLSSQLVSGLEK